MSEKSATVRLCYVVLKTEKIEKKKIEAVRDVKTTKVVIAHHKSKLSKLKAFFCNSLLLPTF